MYSQTIFATLRDVLAELYPEEKDSRIIVADAGLIEKRIAFSTRAQTNWHNILVEAITEQRLDVILQVATKDYSGNLALSSACEQYRHFINQGGHIERLAQNPIIDNEEFTKRGKQVYGDEIHGDKVLGDKIVQEAPKLRIPLQRPPRAAHFQDRKEALDKLINGLRPGQVITLCGPGGIGKSALAAEAVWQLTPDAEPSARFPDGIIFHSFYNQPQAALALEHIARSFGEEIKPSPKEAAQRALAGRRALLILDGTEQADELRLVTDIRDHCGVLVTSRKRQDEIDQRLDVEPLPLEDAVTLLQAWGGSRANNTPAVRHIAELVGRLPLALRLVGRYLAQNEEDAADYLIWLGETPLSALNQGLRREQSVPLLLARSLAQVSETANRVLGMVGLLALTPFPREPITSALKLSASESRQAFGELVDYGLLLRRTEVYEVSHALIHTYAHQEIVPRSEEATRLAAYYITFVGEHQSEFEQLHRVRPHVLALLRSCGDRQAWAIVTSLAWAIKEYLDLQGYRTDHIATVEAGLAAAQATQNRWNEGNWLSMLGVAYYYMGHAEQAIIYGEQALAIAKEVGDRQGEGSRLCNLGLAYTNQGKVKLAIMYGEQALAIFKEIGDIEDEGQQLGNLGVAYANMGQNEQAITYYKQALAIARKIGDRRSEGSHLGNLGNAYLRLGQVEWAIQRHQKALAIAKEIGDRRNEGNHLGNLGIVYSHLGQVEQAITYHQQALALFREIGDRQGEGNALCNMGLAYRRLGQVELARQSIEQVMPILEEIKSPVAETARGWLASWKEQ